VADYTYRFNPDPEKLKKIYGEGYTVAQKTVTTGKGKKKKKSNRWVVTPPRAPSLTKPATDDDPLGIKKYTDAYNKKQDSRSTAHQGWAKDVRALLEGSLGNIYNARESSDKAYQDRMRQLAPPAVGQNAPAVASASGGGAGGQVVDPNQAVSNAQTVAQSEQAKAMQSLAALQGSTNNSNRLDFMTGQLKNYDYYSSQIPAIYNAAKTKYEEGLTSAVMDLESKKSIAQIGADARTYSAQQNLIASLAGVQGANSRAVVQALTGMYKTDQDNATDIQTTTQNNTTRRQISANQIAATWRLGSARLAQQQAQAAAKGGQKLREWQKKQFDAFMQGKAGRNAIGEETFSDKAVGAITPGASLFAGNANQKVLGARQWLTIATKQLKMSKAEAVRFIEAALGGRKAAAPVLRRAVRGL
jgi:hypothetical protein